MTRIAIQTAGKLKILDAEDVSFGSCHLFQKEGDVWIEQNGLSTLIGSEGIRMQNGRETVTFFKMPEVKCWYLIKCPEPCSIGRDASCDLVVCDERVSKMHFQIRQSVLIDQQSTNGTFVNQERCIQRKLHPGDWLVFGTQEAFWIPGWLIASFETGQAVREIVPSAAAGFTIPVLRKKEEPELTLCTFSWQEPRSVPAIQKQKWFQSIGSSFLILLSGLVSFAAVSLLMPEQSDSLWMMLIHSGAMALAFCAYGLWNRHAAVKTQIQEAREQSEKYRLYCHKCIGELQLLYQQRQRQIETIHSFYRFDFSNLGNQADTPYRLFFGYQKKTWLQIITRKPDYLQQHEPIFQQQEQAMDQVETTMEEPFWFSQGEHLEMSLEQMDKADGLFLQWALCAWNPHRKWVWIDSQMDPYHPFLLHEGCRSNDRPLLIRTKQEWQNFLRTHPHTQEHTFFVKEDFVQDIDRIPGSFLLAGREADCRMDPSVPDLSFRRHLLWLNQQSLKSPVAWKSPQKGVELSVILGRDVQGRDIVLDLHENAQGPHGLIAGMTGSGKSELLSWILMQLIVANRPDRLQYLLVDFKGGAFGIAFYKFAHFQGGLTNLSPEEGQRFLISIHADMEKRQRRLQAFVRSHPEQKAHIDAYNAYYSSAPMAHLLIVVDEVAQLKQVFPDFMTQLKEIARIGRSLGIHCILATQKPFGVIDEQIRANTRFKICLQVSSKTDSFEILNNDHAKQCLRPGQFILQVQNEAEEVFGTAFYLKEKVYRHPCGYIQTDDAGKEIYSFHQESETLFEKLSRDIPEKKRNESWVVHPLDQSVFTDELAFQDRPEKQDLCSWELLPGQQVLVYCEDEKEQQKLIDSISCWNKGPVYGLKIKEGPDKTFDEQDLTSISGFRRSCTWIVNWTALNYCDLGPLRNPMVRLYVLISRTDKQVQRRLSDFTRRMVYGSADPEAVNLLFLTYTKEGHRRRSGTALLWERGSLSTVLFHDPEAIEKKEEPSAVVFSRPEGLLVGRDRFTHQPVVWDLEHPLVIAYAQPSVSESIRKMLGEWNKQKELKVTQQLEPGFDVIVLDAAERGWENAPLLWDVELLWVGRGWQEYVHFLKRSMPKSDASMIAWFGPHVFYPERERL